MQYQYTPQGQESPSLLRRMPSIHRGKMGSLDKELSVADQSIHEAASSLHDESSSTLINASDTEQQFDKISVQVNEAIKELSSIYSQIGYSQEETAEKKSEIFSVINDTVASFKHSLQREKETIENECEWLRQQIRIILAMLDDTTGEKTLRSSDRGVVFADEELLRDGHKEDVYQQLQQQESHMFDFDTSVSTNATTQCYLPRERDSESRSSSSATKAYHAFNHDSIELPEPDISMQQQYEYMVSQKLPAPSLLTCKTKLNSIFLEVLKAFVAIFSKFNELNRILWDNLDSIYEEPQFPSSSSIFAYLPDRTAAEEHAKLLEDFHTALDKLRLKKRTASSSSSLEGTSCSDEDNAFIISSPRKQKMPASEPPRTVVDFERDEWMNKLRETNYNIVRIIRNLKITKLTHDVISTLNSEIANSERELQQRTSDMKRIIKECLATIDVLSLSEKDIISLQRIQEQKKDASSSNSSCEGFFDIETLKFIETNPREFGLSDHHLNFITKLANTLEALKEAKQRKWDHYHKACQDLWEKLHENKDFVSQFLAKNSNLTDSAIMNLKMELKRLHLKRSEFVDKFIMESRKELQQLQAKLLFSEHQCRQFKYYAYDINDDVTEDKEMILNEHEAEIEKLAEEYKSKEPILSLYSQLNELTEDQKFLVESSKDSSRLLSKNSCRILLNEEKIRKKIARNMPRILASLKQEIINFNNKQLSAGKRTINVDGEDLFEKVLLIESNSGQFTGKNPRSKPHTAVKKQQATTRSVSPTKRPFGSSTNSSPLKTSQSPSKIAKLGSRSAPVRNANLNSGFKPPSISEEISSNKKAAGAYQERMSPKAKQRDLSSGKPQLGFTNLKPLQTPLHFEPGIMRDDFSNEDSESAGNTLYSTCSKTSPLRNQRADSLRNLSPSRVKPSQGADYLMNSSDDENKENSLLKFRKATPSGLDAPRLSSGSVANSTIIGDDYQSWREERIKQFSQDY